jgi:hypothetical protein
MLSIWWQIFDSEALLAAAASDAYYCLRFQGENLRYMYCTCTVAGAMGCKNGDIDLLDQSM